jgi:hypothetical protein
LTSEVRLDFHPNLSFTEVAEEKEKTTISSKNLRHLFGHVDKIHEVKKINNDKRISRFIRDAVVFIHIKLLSIQHYRAHRKDR